MTFLAMVSCPLSRWERVRVRGFCPYPLETLTPRPLPLGEGARGSSRLYPKRLLDYALVSGAGVPGSFGSVREGQ
jgi:hypothetical protein